MFNVRLLPTTKKDDPPNHPSSARLNYALAECGNRCYLYGGTDSTNKVLETMDVFDARTYKFAPVKYRGDWVPKGRQGAAAIAMDKFTLVVVGGSYEPGFVEVEPVPPQD